MHIDGIGAPWAILARRATSTVRHGTQLPDKGQRASRIILGDIVTDFGKIGLGSVGEDNSHGPRRSVAICLASSSSNTLSASCKRPPLISVIPREIAVSKAASLRSRSSIRRKPDGKMDRLLRAVRKGADDRVWFTGDHSQKGAGWPARDTAAAFVLPNSINGEPKARCKSFL